MITLYTTSQCHLCKKVGNVLDELGIEYTKAYLDKQNSGIYKASLRRRGITILAVPVVIAGEKIYRQNDLIDSKENVRINVIQSMREYEE